MWALFFIVEYLDFTGNVLEKPELKKPKDFLYLPILKYF